MANVVYNGYKLHQLDGTIDLDTHTIKVALVTSTYAPDQDTHEFFSSVTNEVVGAGYSAGGATLGSVTLTQDNTNNLAKFTAANTTWSSSTITARGAVVYRSTGVAGTSPLIAYFDFGTDKISSSGDFTIAWNASGILTLS